jgi:hypothetical protein
VLLAGAILAPAQRTVVAALRVTGRGHVRQFHRYHRVLSHATWSGLAVRRVLLALLVAAFVPAADPAQLLAWFIQRWQLEVTVEEACRHLGLETQRQWSETAIRRTTPVLLGPFSLVTLRAHQRMQTPDRLLREAAWYRKRHPSFADALALVRREIWQHQTFSTSPGSGERRRPACRHRPPDRSAVLRRLTR